MTPAPILDFVAVFFAGLLAGALFVIDYGVRLSLAALEDQVQIQTRQALILRLRIVVPSIFVPTVLLGGAITLLDGGAPGSGFRWAGLLIVLTSFLLTLLGTAPNNKAIGGWQPGAPPGNWRALVNRWERLDQARTWAAIIAFALFLTAIALQLAAQ